MSANGDRFNLSRKVFVGNISYRITQKRLQKFFSKFGDVEYCYLVKDHIKKWSRGIAFVTFVNKDGARASLKASDDDLQLDDRIMRVKPAEESKRVAYVEGWQQPVESEKRTSYNSVETQTLLTLPDVVPLFQHLEVSGNTVDTKSTQCEDMLNIDTTCDDGTININSLCDDNLIQIMRYLPIRDHMVAEAVCRRWRDVAPRSWTCQQTLQFSNMFKRFGGLTDKLLSSLLHRCGLYVRFLDLSASPRLLTDMSLDIIAENCPNLQKIDLSGVAVTDISLRNLGQKCTKLKWLCLQRCFHVADKGLSWFLQNCVDLEYLDIQGNTRVQGDMFHKVGSNLKNVLLNNCSKLKDFGVIKLCSRCRDLQGLQISNCSALTDRCMRKLVQECRDLKTLHISGNIPNVTVDGLICVGSLNHLTELNVSHNFTVDDNTIKAVVNGCKDLQKLDISGCYKGVTNDGVQQLMRCPSLTDLNISYLYMVTDETLELLSSNGTFQHINARACSAISDSGVKALLTFCSNLKLVDLSGCFHITKTTLSNALQIRADTDRELLLCLGGTSIEQDDVEFDNKYVKINMHDMSMHHLKGDRDLILPEPEEYDHEDDDHEEDNSEGHSKVAPSYSVMAAGAEVEEDDEWDMNENGFYDDLLDADDPLAMERWEMS